MKNLKLNQVIFGLAGVVGFMALANFAAVAEGVNAPQNPFTLIIQAFVLVCAGFVVRFIGKIARSC